MRAFDSIVEPVEWGRSTYTILRVPADLDDDARRAGTRRVRGTIEDVEVNLALTRAPMVDGVFLWAGSALLRRLGVAAGEPVRCVLAPADPDAVDLPDDVAAALEAAGVSVAWVALRPAERRRRLLPVASARRTETRTRRVEALVAELAEERPTS